MGKMRSLGQAKYVLLCSSSERCAKDNVMNTFYGPVSLCVLDRGALDVCTAGVAATMDQQCEQNAVELR